MTPRQITVLACRLLAVYLFIDSPQDTLVFNGLAPLLSLLGVNSRFAGPGPSGFVELVATIALALLPFVRLYLCILLWQKAGVLAAIMFGHDLQDHQMEPDVEPEPSASVLVDTQWNPEALLHVGAALMGLWFMFNGISFVVSGILTYMYMGNIDSWMGANGLMWLSFYGLQSAVGFYLLFGGKAFARMIMKVKGIAPAAVERGVSSDAS